MRAALMVLERECTHQRYALSLSDPDDPCTTDERRDVEQQCRRAADLLEALATPPETVEELRERVRKLYGEAFGTPGTQVNADDLRGVGGLNCYRICVGLGFRPGQVDVSGRDKEQAVRAAWFAIVGMMEVGR